jgi:NAD(P)-dependent dehydrogenase (short-subunit alcohol dehydrogenase family)
MRPIDRQTVLVTGSTDGLGRAVAGDLAVRGATVLLHGRSDERLAETIDEIRDRRADAKVRSFRAELSSLDEVRRLGRAVDESTDRLDALVNNAGIGTGGDGARRETSADGIELRFAVNYLAGFLLTELLLPLLRRSAPARVVNVSSVGQRAIDFDDVQLERGYDGYRAYAQSKLAQIMATFSLAERLRAEGIDDITVNAVHPASLMPTKMVYEAFGRTQSSLEDGVESVLRLVTDPDLDGVSGRYFDRLREGRADDQADDAEARRRLWRLSEELVGLELADVGVVGEESA